MIKYMFTPNNRLGEIGMETANQVGYRQDDESAQEAQAHTIPHQHEQVAKAIDLLHDAITGLESRLEPVLRPNLSEPIKAESAEKPAREHSSLYDITQQHAEGANRATDRIDTILKRLELQ